MLLDQSVEPVTLQKTEVLIKYKSLSVGLITENSFTETTSGAEVEPVGEGDGLGMRTRGPEESARLPLSTDLCPLSSVRSLDPERALIVPYPDLLSRERER